MVDAMVHTHKVLLVGAGPGDPGLLTIKGKDAIEWADVLVYDRLVSPKLLEYASPECELIYVGKTPDRHTLPQDKINELLVEKAKEGKRVVRLKGGDPFVFGRGSEEALTLRDAGIEFEIVPGVTSAIAGPAYAGIPVTHRGLASSFSVITGHEDPEKLQSSIDWNVLAHQEGTLLFLMGMKNLPLIASNLIANGKPETTPTAIVQRGTWPDQKVLCATLATVADEVEKQGFTNPSIIVVGDVVSLQDQLAWLSKRPLQGKTIITTRARKQASSLTAELEVLGATVEECPMIRTVPVENSFELEDALIDLESFDWVIFGSTNGVEIFFDTLQVFCSGTDAGVLPDGVVAVGPSTAKALEENGVRGPMVPERFDSEGVLELLSGKVQPGQRVLLVQSLQSRPTLRDGLAALGADVTAVAAYQSVPVEESREPLLALLREGVDAITFTSSSTVHGMASLLGKDASLLRGVALYSIGPITSSTMRECGFTVKAQAESATIGDLVGIIHRDLGGLS